MGPRKRCRSFQKEGSLREPVCQSHGRGPFIDVRGGAVAWVEVESFVSENK